MADMHILTGDGSRWRVVMHFAVPNTDNAVGINHRTALLASGMGGTTSLTEGTGPGEITAAEKTQIEAGEVYEHTVGISVDGNGQSTGGRQAVLRSRYAAEKTDTLLDLQAKLKFYGHTESEV